MRLIPLTDTDLFACVDDTDFESVSKYKWSLVKTTGRLYAHAASGVLMHRMILSLNKGDPHVDHRDGNGLNNQRCNLRTATRSQNQYNRKPRTGCASRFKGVFRQGNRWCASITADKKKMYIGLFDDERDAARAYDVQAARLHGEFARLNF